MSRFIRSTIASVMNATGMSALVRHARRDSLVVLCYHRVLPDVQREASPFRDLVVTPEAFEAQVALCAKHYKCLTLRDAMTMLHSGGSHGPLLAITFDDGYWDNYEYAYRVLDAYDAKATFFVVTSLIGSSRQLWYDQLARTTDYLADQHMRPRDWLLGQNDTLVRWLAAQKISTNVRPGRDLVQQVKTISPDMRNTLMDAIAARASKVGYRDKGMDTLMTANQLRDLAEDGHEVASHTCTHPILTQLSDKDLEQEVCKSKADLERIIRGDVVSIAYPNGDFNDTVVRAVREAGYQNAVTTMNGLNTNTSQRLSLDRVFISQDRLSNSAGRCATNVMQMELNGTADLLFLRKMRAHRST